MTHDLHTALDDFAEAAYADAPPSTIDAGRARADGRRRLRAARLAPVGGGLAVVAAGALVVNTLGGAAPQPAGTQSSTPGPGKTPMPAKTSNPADKTYPVFSTGTDPLVAAGTFGWLPHGLTSNSVTAGAGHSSTERSDAIQARSMNAQYPNTEQLISVTFSATEPPAPGGGAKRPATVPGAKTAYFVTIPGTQLSPTGPLDTVLIWQGADGTWAQMETNPYEDEATLAKVAGGVTIGDHDVPMPIHVEGVPKDLPIVGASSMGGPGDAHWSMVLISGMQGSGDHSGDYTVSVRASSPENRPMDLPTSAEAGSKAEVYDEKCKDDAGLYICVMTGHNEGAPDPLASVGGAQGLLDRTTSLGADPANWTTHVVN